LTIHKEKTCFQKSKETLPVQTAASLFCALLSPFEYRNCFVFLPETRPGKIVKGRTCGFCRKQSEPFIFTPKKAPGPGLFAPKMRFRRLKTDFENLHPCFLWKWLFYSLQISNFSPKQTASREHPINLQTCLHYSGRLFFTIVLFQKMKARKWF